MNAQHTQGRLIAREWSFHSKTTLGYIGPDGHFVAIGDVGGHGRDSAEDEVDARRLAACWNACRGIDTEHLERHGLPDFAQKISDLVAQRDELLAAVEDATECAEILWCLMGNIEKHGNYSVESTLGFLSQAHGCLSKLTAAIAKHQPAQRLSAEAEAHVKAGQPIMRDGTPADPENFGVITIDHQPAGEGPATPTCET